MTAALADPETWTLSSVAATRLAQSADRPFVRVVDGPAQSYGAFIGDAAALASFVLSLGLPRHFAMAVFCRPGLPALHGWMAAACAGGVDVPINPAYSGDLLGHILKTTRPAVMVVDADRLSKIAELRDDLAFLRHLIVVGTVAPGILQGLDFAVHAYDDVVATGERTLPSVPVAPSDPAAVMFTSGTTGPSKGVIMPHRQVCLLAHQVIVNMAMTDEDVFYCAHPLNHIAGKFMGVLAAFASGGQLVLDRKFDAARWLPTIRAHGATLTIAHGPMIEMIHATPPAPGDTDHAMRRLMCCPLPKHIGTAFETRFAMRGVEMWGMTEVTCPCWTALAGHRPEGSCGRVMDEWFETRIVDPDTDEELPHRKIGEIVVRPRKPWTIMSGYMGMPEETASAWRNLWFHTGDAGWRDESGNFYIVDRIKDRIRRRAENISSHDIEVAALSHAGVIEAAAVGVPSGMEGDDDIKLCIVTQDATGFEPAQLLEFLARRLPHFMVPRYIERLEALPRTPTNKIRKRELRTSGITPATWDRHKAGIRLRDLMGSGEAGVR